RSGRDTAALPDGETATILRLAAPIAVAPGDRFVLRRPSPAGTLAGGRVLDPAPATGVSRRRTTPERLLALAAAPASSDAWAVARLDLHGASIEPSRLAPDLETWLGERLESAISDAPEGFLSRNALRTNTTRELRHRVALDPATAANIVSGAIERLIA